jgi:putative redox protein
VAPKGTESPVSTGTQRLVWRHGLLFEGEDARRFRFPISGDPEIEGAKPSDLLPLALASCLAYDVVVVLQKKRQELAALEVVVESEQEDMPPLRFRRITLRFEVSGVIETAAADRALELAEKNCPVLASLSPAVAVVTSIAVRTS